MEMIQERDLLRLSMILENQSATTRDRYICKFAERVIFDSEKPELTANDIRAAIMESFQLEFDLLEIEKAIESKSNHRIIKSNRHYRLSANVTDQLSMQTSPADQLKEYVHQYSTECESVIEKDLLELVQRYIYYCFNSNAQNFLNIIGNQVTASYNSDNDSFKLEQNEIDLINGFLRWPNTGKNKLVYRDIKKYF